MAVQKSKKSKSKRGMRRSHDNLTPVNLSKDKDTNEFHYRHQLTPSGFYRGRQVIDKKPQSADESDSSDTV